MRPRGARGLRPVREVFGSQREGTIPTHRRRRDGAQAYLPQLRPRSDRERQSEHFKAIFDAHGPVPTKGRLDTARFALGAVFIYQLALLHRYEQGSKTNRGLKAFLKAA
jgi:hypothetical protein